MGERDPQFSLSQVVTMDDGKVTGTIHQVWTAVNDEPQYNVVYWANGQRHDGWIREHELTAL